jgi:hypothetical protein
VILNEKTRGEDCRLKGKTFVVPLPPLRGKPMALSHPGCVGGPTEFVAYWRGVGFEPRTAALLSGALPSSQLSSSKSQLHQLQEWLNQELHCKTAEAHVLLNFKSMESGLMTNVITPVSF